MNNLRNFTHLEDGKKLLEGLKVLHVIVGNEKLALNEVILLFESLHGLTFVRKLIAYRLDLNLEKAGNGV